ncbi:Lipase (class 3), partial [Candidatus Arcanobacter lacustris]
KQEELKAKIEQEAKDKADKEKAAKEKAAQEDKLKKKQEELKAKIEQEAKDKADSEKENQASNIEQDNLEIQDPLQEVVNHEIIEQSHEVNFTSVKLEEASILLVNATNSTETINKSLKNNILTEVDRHVDQNIFSIYKEKPLEKNMLVDLDQEAKDLIAATRDRQNAKASLLEEARALEELMNHKVPNDNFEDEYDRKISNNNYRSEESDALIEELSKELEELSKEFSSLLEEIGTTVKLDNEILDLSLGDGQGFDLSDDEGYRDNAAHNQPLNVVSDLDRFLGARKIKDISSTTANALNDQENVISNDYELLHHDVTLDITAVMGRQSVVDRFDQIANEPLGRFFIETYSPILAEFENLYKKSPQLKIACIDGEQAELNKIADDINKLLSQLGWNQQKIDQVDVTKANGDTPTHLGFLRNAILKNKSLAEIVDGYTDENYREIKGLAHKFSEQFYKDFKRMTIEVVDQNGEVIYENLSKEFTGEDPEAINVFLKGTLNLSDEQLKFLVVRLNQRSIDSAGVAFMSGIQKERNNIFHVENNDGKLQLMFVEHKAVMQRNIETEDGDIIGKEDLNEVSYLIDVRNLIANDDGREFLALPTQNTFEVIYYKAFINEAIVTLPDFIAPLKVKINSISDLDEFLRTTADTNEEFDISSYVEVDRVNAIVFSDNKNLLHSFANLAYKSDRSGMKAEYLGHLANIEGYQIVKLSVNSEDVMLFLKDNNIYISYPGTQNFQDIFTDLNVLFTIPSDLGFESGAIHVGFYNSFICTWSRVLESIDTYCKDNNKNIFDINFSFTGHSKGGAVANIAYAALANLLYSENEGLFNPAKLNLMTFAAPRVFDNEMVSNCQNLGIATRVCRVVNDNDIVPKVLFGSLGYKHMGDYVMKKYSKEIFSIKAHVLGSYHGDKYVEHIHESNGNRFGEFVSNTFGALSSVLPKTTANLAIKNQLFKPEEVTERSLVVYQPSNNNQPIAEIDQYRSIYDETKQIVVSSFILDYIKPYIPNEYRLFIREEVTARSLFYIKSYLDKYQSLIKPAEVTKLLLDVGYKYRKINIPLIEPVSNNNVLNFLPAIDKLTNDATSSFVYSLISSVIWPFKKMYYHEEVSVFNRILSENRIDASIDIINNPSEFKRKVLLKLHPDKGGNDAEFKSIQNIKELLNSDINTGQIIIDTTKFAQKKNS